MTSRLILLVGVSIVLGLWGWLPQGATDDIILKNGDVIEGKIDQKATNDANRGRPQDRWSLIYYDEEGKRQKLKYNEIKYIHRKKTSWELRAEALEWYKKQAPRVKDTYSSQNSFGRRCRSKRLNGEAAKHFRRAYEHKKKDMEKKGISEKSHISMAKWCQKSGLISEMQDHYRAAYEYKKKELLKEATTTRALMSLATWCKNADLQEEAAQCYEEILMVDPANTTARAAINKLKSSIAFKLRSMITDYERRKHGWKISVAIEDGVPAKFIEEWKEKIANLSQFIFEATEGQFFITECRIEDETSNGKIIVEKGKLDWYAMNSKKPSGVLAYCKRSGHPRWEVHCPGKCWESVLCHEMFHGVFGLLDEYYQKPQCPCIMRSAPNPQRICNAETHIGGGRQKEPCWDTIKRRYKDVVSPNPKWKFTKTGIRGKMRAEEVDGVLNYNGIRVPKCPPPKFIIIDN
jgi:hypothetical protein